MVEGAHKIWKRPNTPFYFWLHGKHGGKGYYSALYAISNMERYRECDKVKRL